MTFVGWFAVLTILIFRCLLGIDFVPYRKRVLSKSTEEIYTNTPKKGKQGNQIGSQVSLESMQVNSESGSEISDEDEETSFVTKMHSTAERKKLI
jgi:hypothetical protein